MSRERRYYVYIMASRSLNLYTGITDNIFRRALEHKSGNIEGFTKRHNINRLVYYEIFKYVYNAIAREKQIKAWTRAKRIALINSLNPTWEDLAEGWGERFNCRSLASPPQQANTRPAGDPGSLGMTRLIRVQVLRKPHQQLYKQRTKYHGYHFPRY